MHICKIRRTRDEIYAYLL